MMPENHDNPAFWIPDNPDGSGWAEVDWASVSRGSRYHYQHGKPLAQAEAERPRGYRIVTRLETERIEPHENSYYVLVTQLAEFLNELAWHGGDEVVWHVEAVEFAPVEAMAEGLSPET
jgi:hypothetical protein